MHAHSLARPIIHQYKFLMPQPAPPAKETSEHLLRKLFFHKEELRAAFSSPDFYVQLLMIGLALALAWLMAALITRRLKARLKKHPPKRIDVEFLLKPIGIIGPLLALFYLSIVKPFAEEYTEPTDWINPAIQLTVAYLVAKCIILVLNARPIAWFLALIIMVLAFLQVTSFLHSTAAYLNSMAFDIGKFHLSMLNLIQGIVILVVVFWLAGVLSRTLESYLRRSSRLSYNARELTVKFFRVFVYFVAFLITLSALGVDLTAFAVFGGALGVGIGLGLQKITANFVSGITLLLEKSVQIGDLIEVGGGISGFVRQLNIRYAVIEAADGREIMIPNEELVSTRVTNWTHTSTRARIDIKINVDYRSDPALVRRLLLDAATSHKLALKDPNPSCFLREFGDNALQFLLTFWIADVHEGRYAPQSDVMMSILKAFRENQIGIPCPAADNKVGNLA